MVVTVTEGAMNVVLASSWFKRDMTGPPTNWSHENLREPPNEFELLLPSRITWSDGCTLWLDPALAIGIVFVFVLVFDELLLLAVTLWLLEPLYIIDS